MEYLNVFKILQQQKVKYLVCGGLAVNIYGIPRMTADIDLLLDFTEENIANFETAAKILNYKQVLPLALKNLIPVEERKNLKEKKNLIAYSFYSASVGYMNLDVLLDVPIEFKALWKRRNKKKSGSVEINLVALEDLITLKKYANRTQDRSDVLLLSKFLK